MRQRLWVAQYYLAACGKARRPPHMRRHRQPGPEGAWDYNVPARVHLPGTSWALQKLAHNLTTTSSVGPEVTYVVSSC